MKRLLSLSKQGDISICNLPSSVYFRQDNCLNIYLDGLFVGNFFYKNYGTFVYINFSIGKEFLGESIIYSIIAQIREATGIDTYYSSVLYNNIDLVDELILSGFKRTGTKDLCKIHNIYTDESFIWFYYDYQKVTKCTWLLPEVNIGLDILNSFSVSEIKESIIYVKEPKMDTKTS